LKEQHTVVIGAGIGGLTTAALLLQAGQRVSILEAHLYPGGSAGTFYNRGYRFDVGATLAGGFASGGPHARLAETLGLHWPIRAVDPAWVSHIGEKSITQWNDPSQWVEERQRQFPGTEAFWQVQEKLSSQAWDLSRRYFPWPPASLADIGSIARALRPATLQTLPYLLRKVGDLLPGSAPEGFRTFLDAQLLISAQTTADQANAVYGSAALDLPRRGVNSVLGGIGILAQTLVNWIRENGGEIHYRQKVTQIQVRGGRAVGVRTATGMEMSCDWLVANLTPWALGQLLGQLAPDRLKVELRQRQPTWGAFTLYLGLDNRFLAKEGTTHPKAVDHHQVVVRPDLPLGEGNSVFISLSDSSDPTRAPKGMRAATLSTHTITAPWWEAANYNPQAYAQRKADYTERVIKAAEIALPGLRQAIRLCLPGTPVTFQFYTHRPQGMVGGFPQTSLLQTRGPATGLANVWLVGDSVFPGQSTAGTTLGGWRVAETILRVRKK
jgi:C-3',4' desaturase CrtD